jgi:hypothetical protein
MKSARMHKELARQHPLLADSVEKVGFIDPDRKVRV